MTSLLPPISALSPPQRAVYDMLPLDLTRGLLLTRSSAEPYLALGRSFHRGRLPAPTRELIILRVGAATKTRYELFHHVPQARASGVAEELIDQVIAGDRSLGSAELDALMAFVDELVAGVRGRPDSEGLQRFYAHNEIAEIALLVGHYVMTSMFVNVLGIEPEEHSQGAG